MLALYFKTDGTIIDIKPKNGSKFLLQELQELVGGYIEIIPLFEGEEEEARGFIIVSEEESSRSLLNKFNTLSVLFHLKDLIVGDFLFCIGNELEYEGS